jgi:hypothetical protein
MFIVLFVLAALVVMFYVIGVPTNGYTPRRKSVLNQVATNLPVDWKYETFEIASIPTYEYLPAPTDAQMLQQYEDRRFLNVCISLSDRYQDMITRIEADEEFHDIFTSYKPIPGLAEIDINKLNAITGLGFPAGTKEQVLTLLKTQQSNLAEYLKAA